MPDPAPPTPRAGSRGRRWLGRAASQSGLMLALAAVFTMCSGVAATGALLLTAGNSSALSAAVRLADGTERDGSADVATVYVNSATGEGAVAPDAATLVPLVRRSLTAAAAPYRAQLSLWATSPTLFLDAADVRRGYLLDADTITGNATLDEGAWPTAPAAGTIPVALPATTAEALGVGVGARLRLSSERGDAQATGTSYPLLVTGVFTPAGSSAWSRDLLHGRGYDPDYLWLPTYGPFVVAPGALEALDAPLDRIVAVLDPDLAGDAQGVPGLTQRLDALATQVRDAAGPSIGSVRVSSALGAAFARMQAELGVTDALLLAVLVLVLALGAATTALLARALLGRRGAELTLLRDRGASVSQLVRGAAAEAAVLAVLAAAVAAPLALVGYRAASASTGAGGAAASGPGTAFVLSLLAGAALPAVVLVIATAREQPRGRRLPISGSLARSGLDVLAAAFAVVTYLQLRAHTPQPGEVDPLRVIAPAACVLAVAALATRLLPLLTRAADRAAGRGKAFVLPMAAWHVARGGTVRGMFLVVLAASVCTMGVTFLATWPGSQADQAAALVGADLVVEQPGGPGTARELARATGGTASPVADRPVVLGSRPEGVKALALDGRLSGRMLTSRPPDDESWAAVMARLAPAEAGAPLVLAAGTQRVTITGTLRAAAAALPGLPVPVVTATPTLVLVDEAGVTTTQVGTPIVLDGRAHAIDFPVPGQPRLPSGTWRVVAVDLLLADHTEADLIGWGNNSATMQLTVAVTGSSPSGAGTWSGSGDTGPGDVRPLDVAVQGDTVQASFSYSVLGLSWQDAHLRLLAFPATTEVPVALSEDLAGELGLTGGDRIALTWGTTSLTARVVRTVQYVPGHVREAALLTDLESLRRALLSVGDLEPAVDAWWVAGPRPGAAEALRGLGRGPVLDREEEATALRDGPLRAPLPLAWQLAIVAAVALAITGSAANAAAEARSRGTTLARVRALGLSRREALASQVMQDVAVTTAGVVLGAACGALLGGLLIPLLVTSPGGEPAVPAAGLVWPALPTTAVLGAILLGGLLACLPATLAVVGRSTVAALRAGEAP